MGGGKKFPVAMAEKRAMSRVVLKIAGFYEQGAFLSSSFSVSNKPPPFISGTIDNILAELIETIAKAGVAIGIDGIFLETHFNPNDSKSEAFVRASRATIRDYSYV